MNQAPRDRSRLLIRVLPLAAIVIVVLLYGWYRISRVPGLPPETEQPSAEGQEAGPEPLGPEAAFSELERQWLEATGAPPEWPADFDDPQDYLAAVEDLRNLCARLDERPYVRAWRLPGGTLGFVGDLAGDLEARPPVVEGVFHRLDKVRANVTHLFRVLGKNRLPRVLEIIREDPELAEPFALALYRWARAAERCPDLQPAPPSWKSQYEYAAFLVNTVGGQAYLRRRTPRLEALASFYALSILDRAVERDYNPHGVDPRQEIARCKGLMQGHNLLFASQYTRMLDEMEARWKERARPPE